MKYLLRPEIETSTFRTDHDVFNLFNKELNKFLLKKSYGTSVTDFFHIVRIYFDEDFYKPARQFSLSEGLIAISINLDAKKYMAANEVELIKMIANSLIDAIKLIPTLKRKPKDFDNDAFLNDVQNFMIKKKWM